MRDPAFDLACEMIRAVVHVLAWTLLLLVLAAVVLPLMVIGAFFVPRGDGAGEKT